MATYKIAPDTTGEIGMAQMKYGLVNKADYNNSNGVTTEINMETLVVNSTTYQSDLTSKTWDTSQPYGFGEMYGQTWDDAIPATLNYNFTNTTGGSFFVLVRLGSSTGTILYNAGVGSGSLNVSVGDTIYVSSTAATPSDPFALTGEYRVPDSSGGYTTLFFDSAGPGGGTLSGNGTFVITSPNTTAGLLVYAQ